MPRNFRSNKLSKTSPDIKYPFMLLVMDYLDIVSYTRADMPDKKIQVSERDFINFINDKWYVENLDDFETIFYQLKPIVLNKSGKWFEYISEKETFKFEDLVEFKKKTEEEEEFDPVDSFHGRIKNHITNLFETNKEKRKNKWVTKT